MPVPDQRAENLKKRSELKQDLSEMTEIALARARLADARKFLKAQKETSVSERLRNKFGSKMELEEAARQLKAENAAQCKGDEDRLERMNAAVDSAVRDELSDGA